MFSFPTDFRHFSPGSGEGLAFFGRGSSSCFDSTRACVAAEGAIVPKNLGRGELTLTPIFSYVWANSRQVLGSGLGIGLG